MLNALRTRCAGLCILSQKDAWAHLQACDVHDPRDSQRCLPKDLPSSWWGDLRWCRPAHKRCATSDQGRSQRGFQTLHNLTGAQAILPTRPCAETPRSTSWSGTDGAEAPMPGMPRIAPGRLHNPPGACNDLKLFGRPSSLTTRSFLWMTRWSTAWSWLTRLPDWSVLTSCLNIPESRAGIALA